jgi:hypothetical protein
MPLPLSLWLPPLAQGMIGWCVQAALHPTPQGRLNTAEQNITQYNSTDIIMSTFGTMHMVCCLLWWLQAALHPTPQGRLGERAAAATSSTARVTHLQAGGCNNSS